MQTQYSKLQETRVTSLCNLVEHKQMNLYVHILINDYGITHLEYGLVNRSNYYNYFKSSIRKVKYKPSKTTREYILTVAQNLKTKSFSHGIIKKQLVL